MATRYRLDLYPRTDPRDGARLVRFSGLQKALIHDVVGVGSSAAVMRSTHPDAAFLDPLGEQYVRVVREDTVAATEQVVTGFWINRTRHETAVRGQTKRLTIAGAQVMAYLGRSVLAPHTYLDQHPDINIAQDPYGGLWRYYDQGAAAGGDLLGAALWRAVWESQHFRTGPYTHKHGDGLTYTDTHADDRTESAIPDLVLGFDGFVDSDGNAWTASSGEFSARVGENLLSVVQRLMQAGLYVEMDPHTFELRAWENDDHRRDRTGAAWAPSVVRFQVPTDATVATGNIKSNTESERNSHLRRSTVWAGGQDVYAKATGSADIPWEGFEDSDAIEIPALEQLAQTQLQAREEAANAVTPRLKLGTNPSLGQYRPWEEVRLDDLVTVHTGNGQWDHSEATFPVAGLKIELRKGGGWWAFAELGASFDSLTQRQFQVQPVGAHGHAPNPELCRIHSPAEDSQSVYWQWGSNVGDGLLGDTGAPGPVAATNKAVLLVQVARTDSSGGSTAPTVAFGGGAHSAMTAVPGSLIQHATAIPGGYPPPNPRYSVSEWFYAVVPDGTTQIAVGFTEGTHGHYWGCLLVEDVDTADPIGAVSTASGTNASPTATPSGTVGGLEVSGFLGWDDTGGGNPTMDAPGTMRVPQQGATGIGHLHFAIGEGGASYDTGSANPIPWLATAIHLNGIGGGAGASIGDLPQAVGANDEAAVGTSIRATRCDHVHPHSDLSDHSDEIHHHASSIAGLTVGQPVRKNSGGSEITRRRLNFIEGSDVTVTIADDAANDEVDITIASAGGGGGGSVNPFSQADIPPGSPDAQNEEFETGFTATPTFVANSGTPTSSPLLGDAMADESGPSPNPLYNVDSDIQSHFVLQCLNGGKLYAHWPFAPASGSEWCAVAKMRFFVPTNVATSDARLIFGVSAAAPTTAANEPANSIGGELRTNGAVFSTAAIRQGVRTSDIADGSNGLIFVAIVGYADNSISVYVSSDGMGWRRKQRITSGTSPAGGLVTHAYVYVQDITGTGQGSIGMVDWIRYNDTDSNLFTLMG